MDILLTPELETALKQLALEHGVSPAEFVKDLLQQRLASPSVPPYQPEDWERMVFQIGVDCGISLTNDSLSSDGLYD